MLSRSRRKPGPMALLPRTSQAMAISYERSPAPAVGFADAQPTLRKALRFASATISLIEPEVFEAPAVVDAVDHRGESLDIRLPAGRSPRVVNDRAGTVLSQPTLDLPDQLFALLLVKFARLPVDQLVDRRVAITVR